MSEDKIGCDVCPDCSFFYGNSKIYKVRNCIKCKMNIYNKNISRAVGLFSFTASDLANAFNFKD